MQSPSFFWLKIDLNIQIFVIFQRRFARCSIMRLIKVYIEYSGFLVNPLSNTSYAVTCSIKTTVNSFELAASLSLCVQLAEKLCTQAR